MAAPVRQLYVEPIKRGFRWRQDQESRCWSERLYYSQFSAASTSATLVIGNFPAGLMIEGAMLWCSLKFTGGAVSATTFSLGPTGGSATAYINAQDIFTNSGAMLVGVTQVPGTALSGATTPNSAGSITATVTTTSANTNALTAGYVDLFLNLRALRLK